jgi:hypothetical protein
MASKKTSKKLGKGKKMGNIKPLEMVISKHVDGSSPN